MSDPGSRFAEPCECGCEFLAATWHPCAEHAVPHSAHRTSAPGCLDCEALLDEAREVQADEPWFDNDLSQSS